MFSHYLMFNGNCGEAMEVYTKAFGAEIKEKQTYGDMPLNPAFPIAESDKGKVLHARLNWNGSELLCADSSDNSAAGNNMYVSITLDSEADIVKAWDILKENGKIYMELQPSFFAKAHGSLQDRFGINWMFTALK